MRFIGITARDEVTDEGAPFQLFQVTEWIGDEHGKKVEGSERPVGPSGNEAGLYTQYIDAWNFAITLIFESVGTETVGLAGNAFLERTNAAIKARREAAK
jgi:hypothetical protein